MIRVIVHVSAVVAIVLGPLVCMSEMPNPFQPLINCDDPNVAEGKSAIYSGFYIHEFEHSSFRISDHCEVWLDIGDDKCMAISNKDCVTFITVEGVMSPRGQFGHLGMWDRELHVTTILQIEKVKE